ncbi:MAG TPA: S8 family serine peptidase [Candidatus Acidoferrum sp.]|nr:S8 family serine peptidase [Candidatus Acidoferrum sp.]
MTIRRSRLAALVTLLAVFSAGVAFGGPEGGKVSSRLTALYEEHAIYQAASQDASKRAAFRSRDRRARVVSGDRVVVDATADGDARALEAELVGLGMRHTAVFGRIVSGELPIAAVPALANVAGLRVIRPSYAMRRVGSVTSQGDHATNADAARSAYGVTGAGVQVGVLSDSFNCLSGAAGGVTSGDLLTVTVLQEVLNCGEGTDEGRAILEVVHDVAPGASLSFASAFNGAAAFASNILALKANGARVIVDDIFYFDEPMFQDGIIAQAVDTVVSQGAAFFSAAGNDARQSYESAFRAGPTLAQGSIPSALGAPHFFGGVAHNFAPTGAADVMQRITIPSGSTLTIVLQWDSPFVSVSGGAGAPSDLDVYILNADGTQVVGGIGGTDDNLGGDAFEMVDFTNSGPTADFNILIVGYAGPVPGYIKYIHFSPEVTIQEYATASGTVWGHTNAAGARAVGAAFWRETPAFGVSPARLEPYSSGGPTPILFDAAGNRLASAVIRHKPEIVAPDGVSTTFFGESVPGFTSPLFFGTSAAVPHAGAVAALMLEKQPTLPPATVYSILESTALDMQTPGFDLDSGFGLIQADAAVRAALGASLSLGLTLNRHSASPGDLVQLTLTKTNTGAAITQDLYVVVQVPPALSTALGCPAGDAVAFATPSGSVVVRCTATASPQSFPAFAPGTVIPASATPSVQPGFVSVTWPTGLPPGTYRFGVFTTAPNAFGDGVVGPSDVAAFATDQLQSL